jgi:lambda family phage minor tail protein L
VNITERIQKLDPGSLVELFEIDVSSITKTNTPSDFFYFHAGTNKLNGSVFWQGKEYIPFPVQASGFEYTTKGTLPRPHLTAANIQGSLTAMNEALDDLVGAKVTRRCTFVQYLDAVNFPEGNPAADPGQHLPDEVYHVERKVSSNNAVVEWELASAMDLEGVRLPGRSIVANYCPWQYRVFRNGAFDYTDVSECTHTGTESFTAANVATTPDLDVCNKTKKACKLRFGFVALPFGGFPSTRAYKF